MKKNTFYIEKWQIDPLHNSIQQGDTLYEIEPKAMEVLVYLAQHAGDTIEKHELLKVIWPNQEVTDAALARIVSQLRRCFNDDLKSPRYIMTIKKKGYRLIADITANDYLEQLAQRSGLSSTKNTQKFINSRPSLALVAAFLAILFIVIYLYTYPLTEEKAKIQYITTDKGEEMSPALSPDGGKVAYIKTLYSKKNTVNPDSSPVFMKDINSNELTRLTYQGGRSTHPVWSPDSRYIAFAYEYLRKGERNYEICSVDTQSNQVTLITKVLSHTHGISWSPDGKYIVFPDGSNQNHINSLVRLDLKSKEEQFIIEPSVSYQHYSYPNYSPDGKWIAVLRTNQGVYDNIDLINAENFTVKTLLANLEKISALSWKDNNTLFIASGGAASSQLLEFSISTSKSKVIDIDANNIEYLSYSRSTGRLIFESLQQPYNIFQAKIPDDPTQKKEYRAFTNSSRQELEARESPDGNYTALISSRGGKLEIWLRDTLNGQEQKLTDIKANRIAGLDWSAQSDKLAFVATIKNETALYWITTDNKKLKKFSHGQSHYSLIGWESEGSSILFGSNLNGGWKLWRYYTDNNDIELASDEPIMHGRLDPDRNKIYFVKYKYPGIFMSDLIKFDPLLVPGTESLNVYRSWTVSEKGIYYFLYGDIGEPERLYFQSFNKAQPTFVTRIKGIYLNRIYWSNNYLFYTVSDERSSDIAMIEGL